MKLFLSLFLSSLYLFASDAFINAEYLHKHLNDKNLVLLDTTDLKNFKKGHIPKAREADIALFRHWVDKKYLLINSQNEIQEVLRGLGINSDSQVVLYGHNNSKELLKSSYIALTLLAHGFSNVSILNGGYEEWKYEYESDPDAVSTKTTPFKKGNFTIKFNPNILVDINYVRAHIEKVLMIEARPKAYFTGEKKSNGVKRLGHIKGAISSNWRDKFNADDTLKSDAELKEIFLNKQKLHADKEVIAYCTGGLEASMNWYILTQELHFKDVKVYDASMMQWGNLDDTPMQR